MAKSKSKKEDKKELREDIYGVILLVLGIFIVFSLFSDKTGIIGEYLIYFLKWTLGIGVYFIPFGLFAWSLVFLSHREIRIMTTGSGLFIIMLSLVSFIHISVPLKDMFLSENIFGKGGFFGALIAYPLVLLLRQAGAYIFLSGSFLIGLILTTGRTLMEITSILRNIFLGDSAEGKKKSYLKKKETGEEDRLKSEEVFKKPALKPIDTKEFQVSVESPKKKPPEKPKYVGDYRLPPLNILNISKGEKKKTIKEIKQIMENTFKEFEVGAKVIDIKEGPTVTRFEIQLDPGVKVNTVLRIEDDISLALASPDIRIISPIPGKAAVGIEVPNIYRELVTLGDILSSAKAQDHKGSLELALGKDITGSPVFADLRDMPHLLIAGATGSGKSICLNSIIVSILFHAAPNQVNIILIDPKRIELNLFNDLPHLIVPVITNTKQAASALNWAVSEMERRFDMLSQLGVRNLESYNNKAPSLEKEKMPYIVVVIDELADLMMIAANEVESTICRLAQLARAVGIHLVVATQRPSSDIITGLIKSNITSRIAFAVSSQVDSRVILDSPGAEKLVSKGDMLFSTPVFSKPIRIQGSFITESEIEKLVEHIKEQQKPQYRPEILETGQTKFGVTGFDDELLEAAIELVVEYQSASVSFLQRKLRIGYSRAARLMDIMEDRGIVTPQEGSKSREVLITFEEWNDMKDNNTINSSHT